MKKILMFELLPINSEQELMDLPNEDPITKDILEFISLYKESYKILDNVWVIETNTSFSEIRDQISFIGKSRCKIFIMDYVNRWSSVNIPRETTDYLKK